jgi:CheY-like chemotaxis protein
VSAGILDDILAQTHALLMSLSGEKPAVIAELRATLETMEQEASKASRLIARASARDGQTRSTKAVRTNQAAERTTSKQATPPVQANGGSQSRRVLVLDDEESILDIVVDILTSAGHSVSPSTNLSDAIAEIESSSFDLVLSDWSLSGGNAEPLVQAAVQAGVSIVITTGWRGEVDESALSNAGVKAILRKPFDVKKLLEAVDMHASATSRARPS